MSRTSTTFASPITEAYSWLDGLVFPPERPLINVSQAAPALPPPAPMREAMAEAILHEDDIHLYGSNLGMTPLREAFAQETARINGGAVHGSDVAITSGCNEAFAAVIATLCDEGDEVILPTPWYFNHKMWLDMSGVRSVPLPTGADLLPDPEQAAALITPRTRAIALVSPNNPTGLEYPAPLLAAFRDLARARGLQLILDETYRDFHAEDGAPHDLFTDPDWRDTFIHLYSFSKAYRLTGHRVGAIATAPARLAEVEKFLDTVTICPSQLGQMAALWGIENLRDWLAGERAEILARRAAITAGFAPLAQRGWEIAGLGAYFAYLRHPSEMPSDQFAQSLVRTAGVLCLPATMFYPDGVPLAARELRVAFANLDVDGIGDFYARLLEV